MFALVVLQCVTFKAFKSLLLGIIYYGWDSRDEPAENTADYITENWSSVDTTALIICGFIGGVAIIAQIFKGVFSFATAAWLLESRNFL